MKVFVLAPNENWILDRIANEWAVECPEMTTTDYNKADVIWLVSSFSWRKMPAKILEEKKVVATIHHVVVSKCTMPENKRSNFTNNYETNTCNWVLV